MRCFLKLLLLTALLASCKPQTTTVQSSAPILPAGSCTIGKWTGIGASALDLRVSTDFSASDRTAIGLAASEWNSAISGKTFFTSPMNTTGTNSFGSVAQFKDSVFGVYKSTNWFTDVSSSALAITQFYGYVRSDGGLGTYIELTHADIIMNYRDYGTMLTSSTGSGLPYDIPTIVLHEMGHFLGLCHERNHTSIMQPYYNGTQRALLAYDKTKINDLYTNNTITPMLASASVNAISAPAGTPIRGIIELRANGKCIHYINGKKVHEH